MQEITGDLSTPTEASQLAMGAGRERGQALSEDEERGSVGSRDPQMEGAESLLRDEEVIADIANDLATVRSDVGALHRQLTAIEGKLDDSFGTRSSLNGHSEVDASLAAGLALLLIVGSIVAANIAQSRKARRRRASTPAFVPLETNDIVSYYLSTVRRHAGFYVWLFFGTLLTGAVLAWLSAFGVLPFSGHDVLLRVLAVWGVLVTVFGAYYASRADHSSNEALGEARKTQDSVLNFALSLSSFARRVTRNIEEILKEGEGEARIQVLSVIPAFGSVGLAQEYAERRYPLERLHNYLAELRDKLRVRDLEVITHDGEACLRWIINLRSTTEAHGSEFWSTELTADENAQSDARLPGFVSNFMRFVTAEYLLQKGYLLLLLRLESAVNIWRPADGEGELAFQFIVLQKLREFRVFFLASGDRYYTQGLNLIAPKVDLQDVLRLTRGFYLGPEEPELARIWVEYFAMIKKKWSMPLRLNADKGFPEEVHEVYPNVFQLQLTRRREGKNQIVHNLRIDIESEAQEFEKKLTDYGTVRSRVEDFKEALAWLDKRIDTVWTGTP